jgi:integrase
VTLWKRGDIYWAYYYIDGVRYQQSTKTGNRRLAERRAQQLREDAERAAHDWREVDPDLTFGSLAAHFIAKANPTTFHLDRLKWLLAHFADVPVIRITRPTIREYRAARTEKKPLKDATLNRDCAVLRHILYWGVDEGLIAANPLGRLRLPRERPTAKTVVTIDEEDRLLAAAPSHLQAFIILALDTGMRRGELLHQRWEHLDFERQLLTVTQSKTVEGEGREIPLTTRTERLLNVCRPFSGLIFTHRGRAIRTLKTAWRSTLRRAGTRHIRFHDLRHTFNTRMLEAGVLQDVRKALMGHSSGGSVHARYTHVELPLARDAITKLEQWVEVQRQRRREQGGKE